MAFAQFVFPTPVTADKTAGTGEQAGRGLGNVYYEPQTLLAASGRDLPGLAVVSVLHFVDLRACITGTQIPGASIYFSPVS